MAQLSLFDFPKFKITKKIRLIELFGGIGSQAMALRDIGADFEHYKLVEFDKYAVASYNAIHDTRHTTHDIRQIHAQNLEIKDKDKYCYLMTYSFPCTDLSVAGKMQGMSKKDWEEGNSTRSGLLWEVERILKECSDEELPDVLLMENVPQVHAEQNKADFDAWLAFLRSRGYFNFYQDLNAKDYGIPQNRNRCFCVSILSPEFIDYEFPEPVKLEKVMRDYLEDQVDKKYYIKSEKANKLIDDLISRGELKDFKSDKLCASQSKRINGQFVSYYELTLKNIGKNIAKGITARVYKGFGADNDNAVIEKRKEVKIIGQIEDAKTTSGKRYEGVIEETKNIVIDIYNNKKIDGKVCGTITAHGNASSTSCGTFGIVEKEKINKVGQISNEGSQCGTVVSDEGLSPTLSAGTHGYANPHTFKSEENMSERQNSIKAKKLPNGNIRFYRDDEKKSAVSELQVQSKDNVAQAITTANVPKIDAETIYRIRKLTPKECWRLMGYTDEDFEKAAEVNSNTQLYKQAGNAIVKQVLMAIFSQLLN